MMTYPNSTVLMSLKDVRAKGEAMRNTPEGKKHIEETIAWYREIKKHCVCKQCGAKAENAQAGFSFHHRRDLPKLTDVSEMAKNGFTVDEILAEMDKCIVLCPKCYKDYKD